jgi:hypothetical protein
VVLLWGGYGTGLLCSLCARLIQREEIEYEILHDDYGGRMFRLHLVCRSIWQLECARDDYLKTYGAE